jgi:hypothetical protein
MGYIEPLGSEWSTLIFMEGTGGTQCSAEKWHRTHFPVPSIDLGPQGSKQWYLKSAHGPCLCYSPKVLCSIVPAIMCV